MSTRPSRAPRSSEAGGGLRLAVLGAFAAVTAAKASFAFATPLLSDEAFYWQCAQRLAPAYADHPFLTALLVRTGTLVAGDTWIGVRVVFLALAAVLPLAAFWVAKPLAGERAGWLAAGATLLTPVLSVQGVLAVPDVPLLLLAALALAAMERATRTGLLRWWAALGVAGALGFCTHYRFAVVVAAAGLYLVATRAGRAHLRRRGPWLALALTIAGLLPVVLFNVAEDFRPLRYQFVERHAAGATGPVAWILHPLEQAAVTTPLWYALLLVTLVAAWRAGRAGDDRRMLLAVFAATPLAAYFALAPVADGTLMHQHWPAIGYLPLCALLPAEAERLARAGGWRRVLALAAPATAAAGMALLLLGLVADLFGLRSRLRAMTGWPELAAEVRRRLPPAAPGHRPIVVADGYLQASQIDFELAGAAEVFTLDHERDRRHGRAFQYRIWGLDETGLRARLGRDALLAIEKSDFGRRDFRAWRDHALSFLEEHEGAGTVTIPAWRKPREFLFLAGRIR